MGKLTTHVLDTMHGRPASGMKIALYQLGQRRELLASAVTNSDGRCDEPLLDGSRFSIGSYLLMFEVGDYFADADGVDTPPFLGQVPIQFSVADANHHYHVPLLVSPWSYSTYRGS